MNIVMRVGDNRPTRKKRRVSLQQCNHNSQTSEGKNGQAGLASCDSTAAQQSGVGCTERRDASAETMEKDK